MGTMRLLLLPLLISTVACASDDIGPNGEKADDLGPNLSHKELSNAEATQILQVTGEAVFDPDQVPDATFVIHDTAGATSEGYMREQAETGRGPLGAGPQVWVANNAATYIGRPFFDRARPSATVHEKVGELLEAPEIASYGRALWAGVSQEDRDEALTEVLTDLAASFPGEPHKMSATEIQDEVEGANRLLNASSGKIYTTAMWTVQYLIGKGLFGNLSGEEAAELQEFFELRDERIETSVNIEVAQIAGGNCIGGQPLEPYSDAVYDTVANTYLQSAFVAGYFPETTTHFAIDAAHRGHCDPRCFDLGYFYSVVAEKMDHAKGTRYGDAPTYGTVYGQHNTWWDDEVCGGSPRDL